MMVFCTAEHLHHLCTSTVTSSHPYNDNGLLSEASWGRQQHPHIHVLKFQRYLSSIVVRVVVQQLKNINAESTLSFSTIVVIVVVEQLKIINAGISYSYSTTKTSLVDSTDTQSGYVHGISHREKLYHVHARVIFGLSTLRFLLYYHAHACEFYSTLRFRGTSGLGDSIPAAFYSRACL
jgi:hypothetical protein